MEKNVILSVRDLVVKFRVRDRVLTAIRNISLDLYENETLAIVGESGSGKTVMTKTFTGMLESNGFVEHGKIFFEGRDLAEIKNNKEW
jgi:oligopeptide transport system ATP-binding protein